MDLHSLVNLMMVQVWHRFDSCENQKSLHDPSLRFDPDSYKAYPLSRPGQMNQKQRMVSFSYQ